MKYSVKDAFFIAFGAACGWHVGYEVIEFAKRFLVGHLWSW